MTQCNDRKSNVSLPDELWRALFRFLPLTSLKAVSRVGRRFNNLSDELLWHEPKIKSSMKITCKILRQLPHRPIKVLHTNYLDLHVSDSKILEIANLFNEMVYLEELRIDNSGGNDMASSDTYDREMICAEHIRSFASFVSTIRLSAVNPAEIDQLADFSWEQLPKLKSIVLDRILLVEDLKLLSHLPVTDVEMRMLASINQSKKEEIPYLFEMDHLERVVLNDWKLDPADIDSMRGLPVVSVYIPDLCFHECSEDQQVQMIQALVDLETIKDTYIFSKDNVINSGPFVKLFDANSLSILSQLPNITICTDYLKMSTISEAVQVFTVISSMANLKRLLINREQITISINSIIKHLVPSNVLEYFGYLAV